MRLVRESSSSTLNLPPGTFVYNVVPVKAPSPALAAASTFVAASSNDSLTLLSLSGPAYNFSVLHALQNVHKSISCLQNCQVNLGDRPADHYILTSGRDGRIKFWDLASFDNANVALELRTPNGQGVSAVAQSASENLVAAGTELESDGPGDVAVYIWKVSNSGRVTEGSAMQPIQAFTESHTDTITNLIFHASLLTTSASQSGRVLNLVSSSTDGLVNVFDLSQPDEDESVVSVVNARAAVQHLLCINDANGAFGNSGYVCTVSQDEKIAFHSLAPAEESKGDIRSEQQDWDLRATLSCDYAMGLKPLDANSGAGSVADEKVVLTVGACKSETAAEPRIDIYILPRATFGIEAVGEPTVRLNGAHGEEIARDAWLTKESPMILSCGEDTHVRSWQALDSTGVAKAGETTHNAETKQQKKKGKRKNKEDSTARFKPY